MPVASTIVPPPAALNSASLAASRSKTSARSILMSKAYSAPGSTYISASLSSVTPSWLASTAPSTVLTVPTVASLSAGRSRNSEVNGGTGSAAPRLCLRHMISSLWRRRTAFFPTQNTSVAIGTALPPSVLIVLLL